MASLIKFKAYWREPDGRIQLHHEESRFVRKNGRWLYVNESTSTGQR
ncbi:YchJ family metal-binding protein [Pseudohongiella sp.]